MVRSVVIFFILISLSFTSSFADEPTRVNFTILGVLIGPAKVTGKSWDSNKAVDSKSSAILSELLLPGSSIATSSIVTTVNQIAAQGTAAPDVIGYVVMTGPTIRQLAKVGGTRLMLANKKTKTPNSYTPQFNTGYTGWSIFPDTRFRIQLWDADVLQDDNIGTVELTYTDIMHALDEGKATWINVADQSMNQVIKGTEGLKNDHLCKMLKK